MITYDLFSHKYAYFFIPTRPSSLFTKPFFAIFSPAKDNYSQYPLQYNKKPPRQKMCVRLLNAPI